MECTVDHSGRLRGIGRFLILAAGLGTTLHASSPAMLARTAGIDRYMIHYGTWDQATINLAKTYQLVILHPRGGNVTRQIVAEIQGGTNPADPSKRVSVLGYVTVGEDDRTIGLSVSQMRADPRFVGDGTGPRMDPRGPSADGQPLTNLPPLGVPSNGGTGFASWYLDDNSVHNSGSKVGDGIPDRNAVFGGSFVNA